MEVVDKRGKDFTKKYEMNPGDVLEIGNSFFIVAAGEALSLPEDIDDKHHYQIVDLDTGEGLFDCKTLSDLKKKIEDAFPRVHLVNSKVIIERG